MTLKDSFIIALLSTDYERSMRGNYESYCPDWFAEFAHTCRDELFPGLLRLGGYEVRDGHGQIGGVVYDGVFYAVPGGMYDDKDYWDKTVLPAADSMGLSTYGSRQWDAAYAKKDDALEYLESIFDTRGKQEIEIGDE